jgi:hypothetical protein
MPTVTVTVTEAIVRNTIISPEGLKKAGWEDTGERFAGLPIWRNNKEGGKVLLYNSSTQVVDFRED